jgi:hypothetical protein
LRNSAESSAGPAAISLNAANPMAAEKTIAASGILADFLEKILDDRHDKDMVPRIC